MNKKQCVLLILLFMVCPFAAFLVSLFFLRTMCGKFIFILFSALIGFSFTFQVVAADNVRIVDAFGYANNLNILNEYTHGKIVDVYVYIAYKVLHYITNNPHLLFAFFGLVFGLFCYKSLSLFVNLRVDKNTIYFVMILIIFYFNNSHVNINGVRFGTATYVFFYYVIMMIIMKRNIYVLGVLISPLIHYSFFIPCLSLVLLYVVKNQNLLFAMFIMSIIFSFLPYDLFPNIEIASDAINTKIDAYTGDEMKANFDMMDKTRSSISVLSYIFFKYGFLIFIIFLKIKKAANFNHTTTILFNYILILSSVSMLTMNFPSTGDRFFMISQLFMSFLLFLIYNNNRSIFWRICVILLFFLSLRNVYFSMDLTFLLIDHRLFYSNIFNILLLYL